LHRDVEHGFMLLAHTEQPGLYRPPHDHGASWVMYAVLQGEIEMRTYASLPAEGSDQHLVRRDVTRVLPGQVQVYLPGDIHDTRCVQKPALLLRFTERDLRIEKEQQRLRRFPSPDDLPISAAA
jgi:predicted metal-dependent enzyme (double-stranded beta helix superfamily)